MTQRTAYTPADVAALPVHAVLIAGCGYPLIHLGDGEVQSPGDAYLVADESKDGCCFPMQVIYDPR